MCSFITSKFQLFIKYLSLLTQSGDKGRLDVGGVTPGDGGKFACSGGDEVGADVSSASCFSDLNVCGDASGVSVCGDACEDGGVGGDAGVEREAVQSSQDGETIERITARKKPVQLPLADRVEDLKGTTRLLQIICIYLQNNPSLSVYLPA